MNPQRRAALEKSGIPAWPPEEKAAFLGEPMDALVVNASGGTLDTASVQAGAANRRLKVICGSENLVMPEPRDADRYRQARKVYCPTELGGMMGYLTAVEQYLAQSAGEEFTIASMLEAAEGLQDPAFRATRHMRENDFAMGFEAAIEAVCST
jgi:hypothetical protein